MFELLKNAEIDCSRFCNTLAFGYRGTTIETRVDSHASSRYIVRFNVFRYFDFILNVDRIHLRC